MTIERKIRILAGIVILASLALSHYVHPNWIYLTIFAGLNLFQSGFTGFCLPEIVLKKMDKNGGSSHGKGCC